MTALCQVKFTIDAGQSTECFCKVMITKTPKQGSTFRMYTSWWMKKLLCGLYHSTGVHLTQIRGLIIHYDACYVKERVVNGQEVAVDEKLLLMKAQTVSRTKMRQE